MHRIECGVSREVIARAIDRLGSTQALVSTVVLLSPIPKNLSQNNSPAQRPPMHDDVIQNRLKRRSLDDAIGCFFDSEVGRGPRLTHSELDS